MLCPACSTDNPNGFRFCGSCGKNLDEVGAEAPARTLFFGAMQTPNRAKLVLIRGEGLDGVAYHLNGTEHTLGRAQDVAIPFPDDPYLSPNHASFYYEDNKLFVRDEQSINGVFARIQDSIPLVSGTCFLVGEQLLKFEACTDDEASHTPDDSGSYFYGSPRRPSRFKLIQQLRGGAVGMIFRAPTDKVTIGREGNDINFPDDPFISGHHTMVVADNETYTLRDLSSKNGTFVRIEDDRELNHGDFIFAGQQLLRVEVS